MYFSTVCLNLPSFFFFFCKLASLRVSFLTPQTLMSCTEHAAEALTGRVAAFYAHSMDQILLLSRTVLHLSIDGLCNQRC